MGNRVSRSTLFGIPLQQHWSYANSGDFAPTYYLHTDAPLYYYSFTDAYIASQYRALSASDQARFDPMITGFNPADMYGADHIRRVLMTFPGVFSGIGEFSIHKEFVSAKIPGETASLTNPALDRILEFAAEVGLAVILHNDIDMPFGKADREPVYLTQTKALLETAPEGHDHLGPYRPRANRPTDSGLGGRGAAGAGAHRDARRHAGRPRAQPCQFRYFLGRGRQVRRRHTGVDRARLGRTQPPSGSIPFRHRYRGAGRPGAVLQGVRAVDPHLATTDAGGEPQDSSDQLRADLRRSQTTRARLGASPREMTRGFVYAYPREERGNHESPTANRLAGLASAT